MNLPNRLSVLRIAAVPPLMVLLLGGRFLGIESALLRAGMELGALVLVIAVAITDWLDGKIARERNIVSNLGKLLDPLADKVFVTAALVCFVELGLMPAWAVVVIVAREFIVTGLRSLAAEAGRVIAADSLGKHKMGWQLGLIITTICGVLLRDVLIHLGVWEGGWTLYLWVLIWIPLSVTLVLTVWSGWGYWRQNRELLVE